MTTSTTDDALIEGAMSRLNEPPQPRAQPNDNGQGMAPPERDMPWVPSPTLEVLDARRSPSPATLCQGCPNAVWFASPKDVKCYCRVMYITVWSNKEPNQITGCDGIWIGQDE